MADTPAHVSGTVVEGELGAKVDNWLSRMERFGMHGAIVIEHRGELILKRGYGLASAAADEPITSDTIFHLGSLGKQFTASAIMLLQEREKLNVADTIDKHLANVPDDKKVITIHQLLTHTAGFPYHPAGGRVLDLPLGFQPGERWSYSSPGYNVLHDIIENVTGENYCDFMAEHFFAPLRMNNTKCAGEAYRDAANLAHAYTDESDQGTVADFGEMPGFEGAGDFASTVGDLLIWEHALRNNTILNKASTQAMFTQHVKNDDSPMGYGYGWMTTTTIRGTKLFMHGGNLGGFNSDYRRYPDEQLTVIFLSNHFVNGRSMRDAVMNNISLLINGGDAMRVPDAVEMTEDDAARLAGSYQLESGAIIEAEVEHGGLSLRCNQQDGMMLLFAPGADDSLRQQCDTWSNQTIALLTAIAIDDGETTRSLLDPALPFENAWPGVRAMMQNLEGEYGAFTSVEARGVAPIGGGHTGRCFAMIQFENGSTGVQCTWTANGLVHLTPSDQAPSQRFLNDGAGNLVAFDIFSGAKLAIAVKDDAPEHPALVFDRGGTEVVARKL